MISIVVPVYNVEKYLDICVQSILKQTFTDFELILVDDGATDNSGKLCDELALQDHRIKSVHKENGGLSDARNYGIDRCSGEYITFIDSDDIIDEKFLETLYNNIKKENADISIVSFQYVDEESNKIDEFKGSNQLEVYSSKEVLTHMYDSNHNIDFVTAWGKLYKMELLKDIRYPKGKLHEDEWTTYKFYLNSNKVVYQKYAGYLYRIRTNSIMTEKYSIRRLDILGAYKQRMGLLKNESSKILVMTKYMYCLNLIKCISGLRSLDENYQSKEQELLEEIKVYYKPISYLFKGVNPLRVLKLILMKFKYL